MNLCTNAVHAMQEKGVLEINLEKTELAAEDLVQKMLAIRPDIPIILCTGFSSIITKEEAKKLGVREFAMKPLNKKTYIFQPQA